MTTFKTYSSSFIFKPLCALGFAVVSALVLVGCSNPETETTPHIEHTQSHKSSETHADTHHLQDHSKAKTKPANRAASATRSAERHIHGGATLSIVSEENKLAIEFETPLYNLLGFEYAPRTPEEETLVQQAEKTLASPQTLIRFNKEAKCTFQEPISKAELFDDHADDDHDEEHEEHKEAGSHKDVVLSYGLTCQRIEKLTSVHVKFFDVFSNFTDLELVYLGPSKQLSANLSPTRPNADLTK